MRDNSLTPQWFVEAYKRHGSIKAVSRNESVPYQHARDLYLEAVEQRLMSPLPVGRKTAAELKDPTVRAAPKPTGRVKALAANKLPLPPEGMIFKYLFTCVQNDTLIHRQFWDNIQAYIAHQEADPRVAGCHLHVARFMYIKRGLGATNDKAQLFAKETLYGGRDPIFPAETVKYWSDERLEIAPGLVWCGETQSLPTAENPLSGFESYTGRKSGIFPHTKIAVDSIPSMANEGTKFNYTTGTLTQRNHIQRKAGLKADFHHCYGFLLVEVNSAGDWYARQVVADTAGTFYDLDLKVQDGAVQIGDWIDSIVWGDVHVQIADPEVTILCWGEGGILDTLKPRRQFLHDILNFSGRSHHEIKDPMTKYRRWLTGDEDVLHELTNTGKFLQRTAERPWCETVVVNSNHDRHLGRWLKEQDGRFDPVNAQFWADLWRECYGVMNEEPDEEPFVFAIAMSMADYTGNSLFLKRDVSYVICEDDSGGIECGLHGDEGPNGARGNIRTFARMGRKMIVAHTHRAGIVNGVFQVGAMCRLRPEYMHGPDAASHTFCIAYENGKRTLVTIWNNQYRA